MLIAFADWVCAIVSFDFGQVGSPECALPGDAETALLAKFLLTVCITQSSLECRNNVFLHPNALSTVFISTLGSF
eukprot:COSAG06_NODE_2034_length_7781_cov_9.499089_2_plen_75_part_00